MVDGNDTEVGILFGDIKMKAIKEELTLLDEVALKIFVASMVDENGLLNEDTVKWAYGKAEMFLTYKHPDRQL